MDLRPVVDEARRFEAIDMLMRADGCGNVLSNGVIQNIPSRDNLGEFGSSKRSKRGPSL